jgi:hypothetical protein
MSNWKINDFKCKNTLCAKYDMLIELMHTSDEIPECDSCKSTLVKVLTPNWSQGRHHTVNAWRIG